MSPLSASLLDSIWQAGSVWLFVFLLLRCVPARAAILRYRLALGAVCVVTVAWFATWTLLENREMQERESAIKSVALGTASSSTLRGEVPGQAAMALSRPEAFASSVPWQSSLLILWKLGVVVGFCRIASSVGSAGKITGKAVPVRDPEWLAELDKIRSAYGARVTICLKACQHVLSPMVVGVLRPVILLPASLMAGIPPEALRAALAHEVAHVVRRDVLINIFQMGIEALLFFNPFVWMLNQMARREREACCDAMAHRICGNPAAYAEALVWWTREATTGGAGAAMAMSGDGDKNAGWLRDRVMRLLNPGHIPRTRAGWPGAAGVTCCVALFFFVLAQGVHFTVTELTAKERVEMIQRLASPFLQQIGVYNPSLEKQAPRRFSGVIVDGAGKPVSNAVWKMFPVSNATFLEGKTGLDGRFSGSLPNGLLRLQVRADGFAFAAENFELAKSAENVSVVLRQGIEFAVRCVAPEGTPVNGAELGIRYPALGFWEEQAATGTDGVACFHHQPEGGVAELRISGFGYETTQGNKVLVKSQKEPALFSLQKARPFLLTVVDELDGSPIKGVTIRATEMWPQNGPPVWPSWNNPGRKTDANGQATLDGLNPEITYGMQAELHLRARGIGSAGRRGALFQISPGKEKKLTLRLPRERRLKLRVINLSVSEKEIGIQYSQKVSQFGSESGFLKALVMDGVAEAELRGLRPSPVSFFMLGEWSDSPELKAETTEFTVDYSKIKPPPSAKVIINLDPGRNGAVPAGSLFLNWALPGRTRVWDGKSAAVKDGKAEFELPLTVFIRLRNANLMGGTIDEQATYQVTKDPTILTIPVKPAGLIRVKVLEKDGRLAQAVFVSARSGDDQWVSIKQGASQGDAREWYLSGPVGFSETSYRVVVSSGNRFAVSQPFKLNSGNPAQDVILTLPEPRQQEIRVIDEQGHPAACIGLSTNYHVDGLGIVAGDGRAAETDANGRAMLLIGSNEPVGRFTIQPESGPYVRSETTVPISSGKPVEVVVKSGKRIFGRILDKATGAPIPGVSIRWQVSKQSLINGVNTCAEVMGCVNVITDQAGRFEFVNAPAEEVFLQCSYPPGKVVSGGSKSLYVMPGGEEVLLYMEDAHRS